MRNSPRVTVWLATACCAFAASLLVISRVQASGVAVGEASIAVRVPTAASTPSLDPPAESELLQMINAARRSRGLPALHMDAALRFVAREHSQDMITQGYVGHGTLSGGSFLDRLEPVVRSGLVGENVTLAETVEEAHTMFLASTGHFRNIMNPEFHRIGIGVAEAGGVGLAVTEDFAQ